MSTYPVGCRVHVFSADQQEDLGFGTYIRDDVMPGWVTELAKGLFDTDIADSSMPVLKLDSGVEMHGFECWWYPVDDNGEPL